MASIKTYMDTEAMKVIVGAELEETITKFLAEYDKTVTRLTAAGMPPTQVRKIIENDLRGGGRLFGQLKNGIGGGVGRGAGDISGEVSEKVQAKKTKKFKWITVSVKPCPDCEPRHNRVETMKVWRTIGKPRSGFSVCQGSCKCRLVAQKYKGKVKTPIRRSNSHLRSNMAGKHKKLADAEAWANHNYDNIQFDYKGLDLNGINRINKQFKILAKDYPEVADRLEYVGTFRNYQAAGKTRTLSWEVEKYTRKNYRHWTGKRRGWAAGADRRGTSIALNPRAMGKSKEFMERKARQVKAGFRPVGCDTVESTLTHEFGHQVENWIDSLGDKVAFRSYYSVTDQVGLVKHTFKYFRTTWDKRVAERHLVGGYADYSIRETWAEAFAMLYHTQAELYPAYTRAARTFTEVLLDRSKWVRAIDHLAEMPAGPARDDLSAFYKIIREELGLPTIGSPL